MSSKIINRLDRQLEALEIMADNTGYDIENDENYNSLISMLHNRMLDDDEGNYYSFDVQEWVTCFNELKTAIKNF